MLVAGLGGLLVALMRAFPGAIHRPEQWANVAYMGGFLVLVATGLFRAGRAQLAEHLRNAAIWIAIIAVLALGATYRDEFAGVGQRLRLAFSGGDPVATGDHELAIPQDDQGAFIVIGEINGQRVRFMVDTGATETVLSPDDARRIGIDLGKLNFDYEAETANGTGYGAPYTADRLKIGPIALNDFRMAINKSPMSTSLLGRSFLGRLESFEVRGRRLILRWRG
ncbi:MAG: TIGR02281 family clan AA aspartic protease [Caulobacteraceae bacterium]